MGIDAFIERKGGEYQEILQFTRQMILHMHPGIQEGLKWGLPMFFCKKNIAYLDVQKGRPLVGINYAYEIPELDEMLVKGNRKLIGHFYLDDLDDKGREMLYVILEMAVSHDLAR